VTLLQADYWSLIFGRDSDFSVHHHIQTGSAAHTWALSPEIMWLDCKAGHSPPYSAKVKNVWSSTSTPHTFHGMAWQLIAGTTLHNMTNFV